MKYVCVDIETDGPCPGDYSMLALGACSLEDEHFYREIKPLPNTIGDPKTNAWLKEQGMDRQIFVDRGWQPLDAILQFEDFLTKVGQGGRLTMVADNAGFDWSFVNWYFHHFLGRNPLGWSCLSLTSLYKGHVHNMKASFKHLRTEKHSHNALDDARGNAGALKKILAEFR